MLRPRIIPCLLLKNGGLVKTTKFDAAKYVGDPINTVRIFNEKEVDELIVIDIDATAEGREPDYELIRKLAAECRMPLCYGGGVNHVEQLKKIISLGVEKVAISSAAIQTPELISNAARQVGSQSVVVVMDVKKTGLSQEYKLFVRNGTDNTGKNPIDFTKQIEELGAGEIIINSIDNDGLMEGYDLNIAEGFTEVSALPVTMLGGAGSLQDIGKLIGLYGTIGAAAGSLFVFKGKYRAVLINYPSRTEKDLLIKSACLSS